MEEDYKIKLRDPKAFGKRLHDIRKERCMEAGVFSELLGRSERSLANYETGKAVYVSHNLLALMARTLGVTLDTLLAEGGDKLDLSAPPNFCCIHNRNVDCFIPDCASCGWNPAVEKRRKEKLRSEAERASGKTWIYDF